MSVDVASNRLNRGHDDNPPHFTISSRPSPAIQSATIRLAIHLVEQTRSPSRTRIDTADLSPHLSTFVIFAVVEGF
jgi:hypothetical protein